MNSSISIRIYYQKMGGHIHCQVFTVGSMCGELVFDEREWPYIHTQLLKIATVSMRGDLYE